MAEPVTCAQSEELLTFAALGVLSRTEAGPLDEHIRACAVCRRAAASYRDAAGMLPDALDPVDPPASLRSRVMRGAFAGAADAPRRRRWAVLHMTRGRMLSVAGAAVTAAAVALALVAVFRPSDDARRTYTVVGTTTAPAVRGTLTYDSASREAVVTVSGLPAPVSEGGAPPGVYELWLVRANRSVQAADFLQQSPTTGSWTGVIQTDLSGFVAVAATDEPTTRSPEPIGPQVFSVPLTPR